jgi:FtsH-binding integral membrane protein
MQMNVENRANQNHASKLPFHSQHKHHITSFPFSSLPCQWLQRQTFMQQHHSLATLTKKQPKTTMAIHLSKRRSSHRQLAAISFVVATTFFPSLFHAFPHANRHPTRALRHSTFVRQQRCTHPQRIHTSMGPAETSSCDRQHVMRRSVQKIQSQDSLSKRGRILVVALSIALGMLLYLPKAALASTPVMEAVMSSTATAVTATAVASLPPTTVFSSISAAVELKLSLRLLYAALMGAALGKERSFAKHSAGVRTMSLVSMGAAVFTICSQFGFTGRFDPARVAANVVSGVGFVGAGVITTSARNSQNVVHGLTTAATIW